MWLYFRFRLSFREVEELMLQRGILVSHETVRRWCAKFGQAYANGLRRRHARPGDKWHLDEVFVKINGEQKYLWRAVDQDGMVLDILVQNRRERLPQRRRSPAIPVRVQRHLTPLPTPPPPDERPRLPSRDGHPLRDLGSDHRRRRPARQGLSTGPKPGPPHAPIRGQRPTHPIM